MKTPRQKIPVQEVLDWLLQTHPTLHNEAELDRNWVWLPTDLRGDELKPIRESIKEFGFLFAERGHTLPSGAIGTWAHACEVPMRFKRKSSSHSIGKREENDTKRADPLDYKQETDVLAALVREEQSLINSIRNQ